MKHLKVMLLPIALAAVSMTAMAQSGVKIGGRIDLGLINSPDDLTKGTSKQTKLNESSNGRLNISGVEEISADLSAFFMLEMRIDADTGKQTDADYMFKDKAWVGLASKQFGEVKLGRVHSPQYGVSTAGRYEAFSGDSYANNGTRGALAANQWNNSIYYTSPTFNGFNVGVIWQSNEKYVTASNANPSARASGQGFHVQYANGPLSTAFSYQKEQDKQVTTGGDSMGTAAFGAYYDFGVATLMTTYARSNDVNIQNTGKETVFTIGARVPMGPGQFRTSYKKVNDTNLAKINDASADKDSTRFSVGYHYPLSKQTSINLSLVREKQERYNADGSTKSNFSGTGYEVALRKMF
ncbi:porin [Rhodoferax sp. U11-2br]|uniref:porin n=1 Tax=Rhodoferax sp. U11-2br TaxID=2838878 RepID=UPI001BEB886D|nr:porin [Rhodoferax sp. U11-2br]MBT3067461.1 porin [Rhodoferax sp. U11-2br]